MLIPLSWLSWHISSGSAASLLFLKFNLFRYFNFEIPKIFYILFLLSCSLYSFLKLFTINSIWVSLLSASSRLVMCFMPSYFPWTILIESSSMFYSISDRDYFCFLYTSFTFAGIMHYFLALSRVIWMRSCPFF